MGYRFKTRILPLLKTHLWLHYFYPIAGFMGVYPSFLQPGPSFFDMGGGTSFFTAAYRLTRVLRKATAHSLWGGHACNTDFDDALAEAISLTLNSRPSLGLSQNIGFDSSYGFGGYWGSAQTSGLIDSISTIRPFFRSLEGRGPSPYNPFSPYPTAPFTPRLDKLVGGLNDKFYPKPSTTRGGAGVAKPPRSKGVEPSFYKIHRESPNSHSRWEESLRSLPTRGGCETPKPRYNQRSSRGQTNERVTERADLYHSPNLRWGNSLGHRHMDTPYAVSKHSLYRNKRSGYFSYPEEAAFFSKKSPSNLKYGEALDRSHC